jgi:hypothetical protein
VDESTMLSTKGGMNPLALLCRAPAGVNIY